MIKYCFLDLETGGIDPKENGILEIGCILEVGGHTENLSIRCNPFPTDVIDDRALKVNKFPREELFNHTPPREAYKWFTTKLSNFVSKYNKKDKFFLVGYQVPFDESFLREFFLKNDDKYFNSFFFYPSIDVAVLVAMFLKEERHLMINFKLATVAQMLKIPLEEEKTHGALYDAHITKKIFHKIMGGKA